MTTSSEDGAARLEDLEERLLRSNAVLNALMDAAPDGMLVLDSAGQTVLFNKAYLQIWNLEAEQVEGSLAGGLFDLGPESVEDAEEFAVGILSDLGKARRYSWREIALQNGTVIEEITRPFEDSSGTYAGRMWFFRDVTTRVAFEKQLMLSAELFLSSPKPMAVLNPDCLIIQVNQALVEHFGISEIELVGMPLTDFVDPSAPGDGYAAMAASLAETGTWQGEVAHRAKDGKRLNDMVSVAPARSGTGVRSEYIADFADIKTTEEELEKLRQAAHHDPLTGLPNRAQLDQVVAAQIGMVQRHGGWVALAMIDLDGFKPINDTYGHQAGDAVLVHVSNNLKRLVRESDRVFRLGGDEFIVSAVCNADMAALNSFARKMIQVMSVPFKWEGQTLKVSASVGVAYFPVHGSDVDHLIAKADAAMYDSKKSGKGRAVIAGFR